jgi:AraC family transcriptional regulator, regulatory protein of adaptative response / methylated-DNA-[protein]-cysteine methyltransferase
VALAIPCHRVVSADGKGGGYRWGTARKKTLLASEREDTKNAKAAKTAKKRLAV